MSFLRFLTSRRFIPFFLLVAVFGIVSGGTAFAERGSPQPPPGGVLECGPYQLPIPREYTRSAFERTVDSPPEARRFILLNQGQMYISKRTGAYTVSPGWVTCGRIKDIAVSGAESAPQNERPRKPYLLLPNLELGYENVTKAGGIASAGEAERVECNGFACEELPLFTVWHRATAVGERSLPDGSGARAALFAYELPRRPGDVWMTFVFIKPIEAEGSKDVSRREVARSIMRGLRLKP